MSVEDYKMTREFLSLILANQAKIHAYIRCMIPQEQNSEDILQDTLAEMWRKYSQFGAEGNFLAWGCTIAKYKIFNFRRKQNKSTVQFSDNLLEIFQNESRNRISAIDSRIDQLKNCIRKLSPKQIRILNFRYQNDLNLKEIARIYECSHQAICRAISVIHSRLADCINRLDSLS